MKMIILLNSSIKLKWVICINLYGSQRLTHFVPIFGVHLIS